MITVLLLVFFFKGGIVETQTITANQYSDCQEVRPTIVADYMTREYIQQNHKLKLENIIATCIEVDNTI